jgi:hypothetical protein
VRIETIFLDDGGVLSDNERRSGEWRRLVGEFLAPRLGGSAQAWGEANFAVFERQWRRFERWLQDQLAGGAYGDFFGSPDELDRWLGEMCDHVGVARPPRDACPARSRDGGVRHPAHPRRLPGSHRRRPHAPRARLPACYGLGRDLSVS